MALQNYTGSLVRPFHPLFTPHPFMVAEFDTEHHDDIIKLCRRSCNANIRFIRERLLGFSKRIIEKIKQESSKQ
jgi:hypothetical protein